MKIGKIIRKYRKEQDMTQEEMASRLGVSTAAVNKWENDNSYPDITLLAPIARLLNISLDELLSFREDLTEKEIYQYVDELNIIFNIFYNRNLFVCSKNKSFLMDLRSLLNLCISELYQVLMKILV